MEYLSPREYSDRTGLNRAEVIRQCNLGNLKYLKTEGGFYKVLFEEKKNELTIEDELKELKSAVIYQTQMIQNLIKKIGG